MVCRRTIDGPIFAGDTRFVLENLNTLGWVLIILGVVQLTAGFSLFSGATYGRMIGIIAGSLGAVGALLSIVVALRVRALRVHRHGIVVFGEDEAVASAP